MSRVLSVLSVLAVVCSGVLASGQGLSSEQSPDIALSQRSALAFELAQLPVLAGKAARPVEADYLVGEVSRRARAFRSLDSRELVLDNGLLRRTWRLEPNAACVGFENLMTGNAMLRSVRPEARVKINGSAYDVGGLAGQPNHAYLTPEWLESMTADPKAFRLVGFELGVPAERFAWKRKRHAAPDVAWPPKGIYLRMDYLLPAGQEPRETPSDNTGRLGPGQIGLSVHYELYDGVPVMSKWITVHNHTPAEITLDRFTGEELALVEHANWVEHREGVDLPRPDYLHVETDFAFGGFHHENANRHAVHWRPDPLYSSQVNYARKMPCLLVCEPTYGPAQRLAAGESFEGFRVFELVYDDANRERRGLAHRRMVRSVAPWVTENPITHHLLSNSPQRVRQAIDEAAEVGFEAIILSFGSGFNMENRDPEFLEQWKAVADYAAEKGIELGCYSLFSSRGVGDANMIVSPEGQSPTHGKCPAVTSPWGQEWLKTMDNFYAKTGFDQFENDGPYPGDIDITPRPPLQQGISDSRWVQWRMTAGLYRNLRGKGIYINAPDYYFLNGSNKCGMGYREVNWSLPRAHQVIHTRQNIYDGTWSKTPSMGWMFVPLSQYHGGGAAATIEPLDAHLDHYERMMQSNFSLGVQAHYRGPRLFDTYRTRDKVADTVSWFKQYRDILESDLIHGRRADGRDLDWMLHVNPRLKQKGMLVVFNPLNQAISKELDVNLYYTGLTQSAQVRHQDQTPVDYQLNREYTIRLPVTVPANAMTWFTIGVSSSPLGGG